MLVGVDQKDIVPVTGQPRVVGVSGKSRAARGFTNRPPHGCCGGSIGDYFG